jgi:DNA-binding CsgD family transcriptional regulator
MMRKAPTTVATHFDSLPAFAQHIAMECAEGRFPSVDQSGKRRIWVGRQPLVIANEALHVRTSLQAGSTPTNVAIAIILTPAPDHQPVNHQALPRLTPREREVAEMLGKRLTTLEVASALGISSHTARHHVQHVLTKMGVTSRRQIGTLLHPRTARSQK